MDREIKSQERGLRNRIKPDAGEGGTMAPLTIDENMENRQPNQIPDIFDV